MQGPIVHISRYSKEERGVSNKATKSKEQKSVKIEIGTMKGMKTEIR